MQSIICICASDSILSIDEQLFDEEVDDEDDEEVDEEKSDDTMTRTAVMVVMMTMTTNQMVLPVEQFLLFLTLHLLLPYHTTPLSIPHKVVRQTSGTPKRSNREGVSTTPLPQERRNAPKDTGPTGGNGMPKAVKNGHMDVSSVELNQDVSLIIFVLFLTLLC